MKFFLCFLTLMVVALADRPCPGNADHYTCDKNGFYNKIQKEGDISFCVTPHNGVPAYDTRTKGTPKCGACYEKLHELYKNGQPKKGTQVPRCEAGTGHYDVIQCDHSTKKCFCTDHKTGKTIKGSEKPFKNEQKITCDDIEITLWEDQYKDLSNPPAPVKSNDPCTLPFDKGTSKDCKKKPSIRYFYHRASYKVLAFEYLGCGGNENNFETPEAAQKYCSQMIDFLDCNAGSSAVDFDGNGINCGNLIIAPPGFEPKTRPGPKLEKGCPQGYYCITGHHIGRCCNEKLRDLAKEPKCKNGKALLNIQGTKDTLMSTSCDANHCPKGSTCEANFNFAFCCPK